jgi:4a-hydroxytetrahydrobiopterin dehydratase
MSTPAPHPPTRSALSGLQIVTRLAQLEGWTLCGDGAQVAIEKRYVFKSYMQTLAFVNAVAFCAERADHHPELLVTYQSCNVRFNTHDVGGITALDFESAQRIDALLQLTAPT